MLNSNVKILSKPGIGFYEVVARVPAVEREKAEDVLEFICGYLKLIRRQYLDASWRQIDDEGLVTEFSFIFKRKKPKITTIIKAILERRYEYENEKSG